MKFYLMFFCLALYVALCLGRKENRTKCKGDSIFFKNCHMKRDAGHARYPWCKKREEATMWFYNAQNDDCSTMSYHGCSGNGNRFCTKQLCQAHCKKH